MSNVCQHHKGQSKKVRYPLTVANVSRHNSISKANRHNINFRDTSNTFIAHYSYLKNLQDYPLNIYGEIIITGFVAYTSKNLSFKINFNNDITNLCIQYLYNINDELYQLAFSIYRMMRKIRKKSLSKHLLMKFITVYLHLQSDDNKIKQKNKNNDPISNYLEQLIELKFINKIADNLYYVPSDAMTLL